MPLGVISAVAAGRGSPHTHACAPPATPCARARRRHARSPSSRPPTQRPSLLALWQALQLIVLQRERKAQLDTICSLRARLITSDTTQTDLQRRVVELQQRVLIAEDQALSLKAELRQSHLASHVGQLLLDRDVDAAVLALPAADVALDGGTRRRTHWHAECRAAVL